MKGWELDCKAFYCLGYALIAFAFAYTYAWSIQIFATFLKISSIESAELLESLQCQFLHSVTVCSENAVILGRLEGSFTDGVE